MHLLSVFLTSDKLYPAPPAGVALGLAWTSMGGSTLYIETLGQVQNLEADMLIVINIVITLMIRKPKKLGLEEVLN